MTPEEIKKLRDEQISDQTIAKLLAKENEEAASLLGQGMSPTTVINNITGVKEDVQITDEEIQKQVLESNVPEKLKGANPSIPRILTGIATEIAIAEGAKVAGTAAGAKIGAAGGPSAPVTVPAASTIGYVTGAISGGVLGSIAAQKIEGQPKISVGRVASDTLLNLIPGVKATKGNKIIREITEQMAKRPIRSNMLVGAVTSPAAMAVESFVETGEIPNWSNMGIGAATASVLAGGLGVTTQQAQRLLGRYAGRSGQQLDDLLARGDRGAVAYVDALTSQVDPDILKGLGAKQIIQSFIDDSTKSVIAPSKLLGREASDAIRSAEWRATAGKEIGGILNRNIKNAIKNADDPVAAEQFAMDYMVGNVDKIPTGLEYLGEQISQGRKYIREYQEELLKNHYSGQRPLTEIQKNVIEDSLSRGDYVTRSYRFFDDEAYKPSKEQYDALMKRLTDDGMTPKDASVYITELNAKKSGTADELQQFIFSQNAGILKERQDLSNELRSYLGEYTEPGQRMAKTMSNLSRLNAFDTADNEISKALLNSGVLQKAGADMPRDLIPIKLRRGNAKVDGEDLYGSPDIQRAINNLYGSKADQQFENEFVEFVSRNWQTGTSLSKAAKVIGNPPSYAVQLYGNLINAFGLGSNLTTGVIKGLKSGIGQFADGRLSGIAGMKTIKDIDYFKRVKELGLVPKALQFADIQAGLKKKGISKVSDKIVDPLGKVYSTPDIMGRIMVFETHKELLRKAANGADEKQIEAIAARYTNNTYQNYDFLNSNLRSMSRYGLPFSQFASFTLELARNQYNQANYARKMLNGELAKELSDELGVKVNDLALRKEGFNRAARLGLIYAGGAAGLTIWNRSTTTPEEEKAIRESVVPEWDSNMPIAIRKGKDGKVYWKNSTYIVPQMQIAAVAMAALRGESFSDALNKAAEAAGDPLLENGGFMFKTISQATQNFDIEKQREITDNPDQFASYVDRAAWTAKELFKPGIVREIEKSKNQPAMVTAMRQAGIRVNSTTPEEGFSFKVRDIAENINTTKKMLGAARYTDFENTGKLLTKEELGEIYLERNNAYRSQQESLINHIKNMRVLKMDESKIYKILEEGKVGTRLILMAMDGEVEDLPVIEKTSVSDVYERVLNEEGDFHKIMLDMARVDPEMAKAVVSLHKQKIKDRRMDITSRDDLIRKLPVIDGERAKFIYRDMKRSGNQEEVLRNYQRKGLADQEVTRQIRMMMGGEKGMPFKL